MRIPAILCLIFCFGSFLGADIPLPQLAEKRYVDDLTNSLPKKEVSLLEEHLKSLDEKEGIQLVVVIVPSLEGKTLEEISQLFMSRWQIGAKGRDSGCLLLISTGDKSAFIDLGYGLTGRMDEETAKKISEETITPYLHDGATAKAVDKGLEAIFAAMQIDFASGKAYDSSPWWGKTSLFFFFIYAFLLFLLARFSSSRYWWLSPSLGFAIGITQSIGLAIVLAGLAGVMVGLCVILRRRYTP